MEQKIRAILFYLSVILFFILVPVILLYSFGYKVDINRLKVIKTGLIYIRSIPEGAKVSINGRHINETTPVSIGELMPGAYRLSLELEKYYPWHQMVLVEPGKSTALDDIILFPLKPHLDRINVSDVEDFYIFAADKDYAYCVSKNKTVISKARLNPEEKEASLVCNQLQLPDNFKDFSLSPDQKKILYSSGTRLDVVYVSNEKPNPAPVKNGNFFIITDHDIINAFWHSGSEHIIVITDKDIKIYELIGEGKSNAITVSNINNKYPKAFYNTVEDTLYFTDTQEGPDGKLHNGLYRLDISKKSIFSFLKEIKGSIE